MAIKTFRVRDTDFEEFIPKPLITGDVGAYRIVLQTDYNLTGHSVRIVAKRADGVILEDSGTVSEKSAQYVLKSGIYAVEGEVEVRIIIVDAAGNCLTDKALIFEVKQGYTSADMQAKDSGRSVADMALAHISNTDNPHGITAEQLGLGDVLLKLSGKADYKIVTVLPAAGADVCNCFYLLLKMGKDYDAVDNQVWEYGVYICCPSYSTGGAPYTWTRINTDRIDELPVEGSNNLVTSGGVYNALGTKKNINATTLRMLAQTAEGSWIRIAAATAISSSGSKMGNFAITRTYNNKRPESVLFNVSICYDKCIITQLARGVSVDVAKMPKVRVIKTDTAYYVDVFYTDTGWNDVRISCDDNAEFFTLNTELEYSKPETYTLLKEFEFSDAGIKAEKVNGITITGLDTVPTSGSTNLITSGAVYNLCRPADSTLYDTGRVWIDGRTVYRQDFAVRIADTSAEWENGEIVWADIVDAGGSFITVTDVQAFANPLLDSTFCCNNVDVFNLKHNAVGIYFDKSSLCYGIDVWGYVEFCLLDNSVGISTDYITKTFS